MKLFIYPYSSGSESAKLLAERLGALRIKLSNSTYEHKDTNLVINWGNSRAPSFEGMLNRPEAIRNTVDKLSFFRLMNQGGRSSYIPDYWTNAQDIPDSAFPIFCRTTTTGCDGAGIVIANDRSELVPSNLYTSYVKDSSEYRVTIFRGKVTDIQTKRPRLGENAHPYIRTYKNGWGFQRLAVPDAVREEIVTASLRAIDVAGLDFAGVDVLFTSHDGAKVLELNTAMGLEGGALDRFAEAVEEYAESITPKVEEPAIPVYSAAYASVDSPIMDEIIKACHANDWKQVIKIAVGKLV